MQDASLKGGCLIGKRDNCVGGAVAMALCYSFTMLCLNSWESQGTVKERREEQESEMSMGRESHCSKALVSDFLFSNTDKEGMGERLQERNDFLSMPYFAKTK